MLNNPSRVLFMSTLMLGTVLALSSTNWLGCWIGLEINLLSFIPLMTSKSQFASEAALKYFLVQALASSVLLLSALLLSWGTNLPSVDFSSIYNYSLIISTTLLLKMGAAPFHFWFPGVMEGLNWVNNLVLMTWQKVAPFVLLSYVITQSTMFFFVVMLSIGFGSIGGLNQTSLRKLMAYSSINHLGWMISALMFSVSTWGLYFVVYVLLSTTMVMVFHKWGLTHTLQIYGLSSNKIVNLLMFCNLLSLGGLPPFLGFMPKWMVIQLLVTNNCMMLVLFMVCFTLVALYFYARMAFPGFLISHSETKWSPMMNRSVSPIIMVLSGFSLGGLVFSSVFSMLF